MLPYLRFNRDKRGYENTFVVHSDRRRRGYRVLYWFRTPPGVKVGRGPLDEDAIRMIEQHNPDLDFDWTRILSGQGSEGPGERRAQPRPRTDAPAERPRRGASERNGASREVRPEWTAPGGVQGAPPINEENVVSAAERKLGAEGLARLRGRYAEMLARISDRIADPERQAELKATAERLNPDAWVTDADVLVGLDAYEATVESLRGAVGSRRPDRGARSSSAGGI